VIWTGGNVRECRQQWSIRICWIIRHCRCCRRKVYWDNRGQQNSVRFSRSDRHTFTKHLKMYRDSAATSPRPSTTTKNTSLCLTGHSPPPSQRRNVVSLYFPLVIPRKPLQCSLLLCRCRLCSHFHKSSSSGDAATRNACHGRQTQCHHRAMAV
jgi:hypothetical protein